ncbi:YARHG domain-containing protein [Phycobacter sp. K97]|uniref:YARHG domain-containing protein n=1 Tax=Phycobacter sedimenti TaxID=3133977 RepID=UPI00311E8FF5
MLIALTLLAGPAAASDYCHDLWYTRNAIMDQAGYCFGSVLGQAVFGTGPCIGKSVTLSPQDNRTVARLRAAEK